MVAYSDLNGISYNCYWRINKITNSGLSMVDWRPIMGTIPPLTDLAWIEVFNSYKSTPEFQIVNKSMSLSEFKYI